MTKSILLLAGFGLICLPGGAPAQDRPTNQDGSIVKKEIGFPFETYDQWIEARKRQFSFDEAEFRSEYPPERFAEFKTEFGIPFDTYEEWIQVLRERFRNAEFSEIGFGEKYPPEVFQKYKAGVEYQSIRYMSDGLEIAGYILRPKNTEGQVFPVIIYNRGGNREVGRIEFEALYSLFDLVLRGYVVVASQYRGCCGGEGRDEFGGEDVNDVLNLFPLIDALPYADPTRVGMYGWSRGGMMTYLVMARTDRLAAAVIAAGPTDLPSSTARRPEVDSLFSELVPDYGPKKEEQLRLRSALFWPDQLHKSTKLLLLQGSADWRNDPTDVLRMAQSLFETKHPFRLVFYEDGDHGLTRYEAEVRTLVSDWFDRYVRDCGLKPKPGPE